MNASLQELLKVQPPPIRTAQSAPILTDDFLTRVPEKVAEALRLRRQFGLDKYGTVLKSHNGRNPLADALQETLDLIVYLQQARMEGRPCEPLLALAVQLAEDILTLKLKETP